MNEKLIPNPEDRIMCVKVGKVKRENLYEMPRKYWKVDITRARKVTHVLAIVNGIVEEVYNPVDWKYTEDPKHIGRCEFLGIEDENTTYIGKDVSAFYGKSQNPVKYINMQIMENPVFNEIKNWHLFTEKFGEEYLMHDASIKGFDLNGDELTIVLNTVYEVEDGKVYDVTFRFSNLIRLKTVLEIGNDYAWGIDVQKDKYFKNLFQFTIESAYSIIECFNIELVSITEAEPFERGMICLDDPNVAPNNSKHLWRT